MGQNTLYNFELNSALRHTYLTHLVSDYPLGFQISKAYKPRDQWMKRGERASAADSEVTHFRLVLSKSHYIIKMWVE